MTNSEPTKEQIYDMIDEAFGPWELFVSCQGDDPLPTSPVHDFDGPVTAATLADMTKVAMSMRRTVIGMIEVAERQAAKAGMNPVGWRWELVAASPRMGNEVIILWKYRQ